MGQKLSADSVFRDFEVDGVPASGKHAVVKGEIRELLTAFDPYLAGATVVGPQSIGTSKNSRYLVSSDAANVTWTLAKDAVPWTLVMWLQGGAGQIVFVTENGLPLAVRFTGLNASSGQYAEGKALCISNLDGASAVWLVNGDMTGV